MSISMERFASNGHFLSYDPFVATGRAVSVFTLQCRSCGFEPEATDRAPRMCPKCSGQSWERFTRPGSLLADAERF